MQTNKPANVFRPPATIGILGGGQLGRMMALDGRKMGYRFQVLDPLPDCPAAQVSDGQVVGQYSDVEAARQLAALCDLVTYEFENVDADVAAMLEETTCVPQGSALLATTQHRVREKTALRDKGLPVTPFRPVNALADVTTAVAELGSQLVIKTTRGGYDGKGQWMVRSEADIAQNLTEWGRILADAADEEDAEAPLIAEQLISFAGELSVVVARNARGEVKAFPPSENIHVNHILHLSIVPPRFDESTLAAAAALAERVVESLGVIGLVAVELFVTTDGQLYINELAPRPHNSGHYTQDACATSQFEQHIRAVCNLPLGDVTLFTPVVMVNILGQHLAPLLDRLETLPGNVKVHLYGKASARDNRKMGHLNILADRVEDALAWVDAQGVWT